MTDLLIDGFKLLNTLPKEEIEKRIEWLENALASYRTILAVKNVMENKPGGFVVPQEFEAILPEEEVQRKNGKRVSLKYRIPPLLTQNPGGLTHVEIANKLGCTKGAVYQYFQKNKSLFTQHVLSIFVYEMMKNLLDL